VIRPRLPEFVQDVVRDPSQRGILIAGALALFAVGMVPRVLSPGLPDVQQRLREQPGLEDVFLLLSLLSAAAVIVGGLISDIFRRRGVLIGALALMLGGMLTCVLVDHGPVYYAAGLLAVAASGVVLAYGIGSVAVAYEGVPRATALGALYAAYGAGGALAPALLTVLVVRIPSVDPGEPAGFAFETWLAYLAAGGAAAVATWAAWRWMPPIPGSLPAPPALIARIAVWSVSILAIVVGVLGLSRAGSPLLPIVMLALGLAGLSTLTWRLRRTRDQLSGLRLDMRALSAALAVGVVIGVAQAVPMMTLPIVFERAMGYGALFATLAIAPFAIALFVAGPVSGMLLQRFGPRGMMALGTALLGVANILLAVILGWDGPGASYVVFIAPLASIGAGFVLATTVRTAIVFASTPRGLPGSAAAINEASVALGSRLGIVAATSLITLRALDTARSMVVGLPEATALVDEFRGALVALGTPRFAEVIAAALVDAPAAKASAYITAYLAGVELALVASGIVGIVGAGLAWSLTGRREPLRTVFEMQDERDGGSHLARPADARPADARPADARPADARPADARPADARPAGEGA
jgi:DHA2 family multidrug resistance protein-like MFS transporter